MNEFLTIREIADNLGCSPETVRRFVRARKLRAQALVHEGGRVTLRVHRDDFAAFRAAYVRDTLTDAWEG